MFKHQKVGPNVQFLKIKTEKCKKLLKIAAHWSKMTKNVQMSKS